MRRVLHKACVFLVTASLATAGCSSAPTASAAPGGPAEAEPTGASWTAPDAVEVPGYSPSAAVEGNGATLDVSAVAKGVVFATAGGSTRHKLQVTHGDESYNYDVPTDGSPVACPVNMGDGSYTFRVLRNIEGSSYVEVLAVPADVSLESEFSPFTTANVFCDYDASSAVVAKAREVAADADNEGAVVQKVYQWVVDNIDYDDAKAAELAGGSGYVPDPDKTLAEGKGICFDYSSLAGAMLRSLGVPCRVVTGYVDPDDLYHAWNMVYIDGTWHAVGVTVDPGTWSRVDTTFGASGNGTFTGSGTGYRDRYVY